MWNNCLKPGWPERWIALQLHGVEVAYTYAAVVPTTAVGPMHSFVSARMDTWHWWPGELSLPERTDNWLVVWNIFIFHNIWDNPSIGQYFYIFFRGFETTNQIRRWPFGTFTLCNGKLPVYRFFLLIHMVIFHMEMTRCVVIHNPPVHQWRVGRSP